MTEEYGDPGIASFDAPVPKWLKIVYIVMPIWGIACGILYWNGSWGWLDPNHWRQLEIAANTTFPATNHNQPVPRPVQEAKAD